MSNVIPFRSLADAENDQNIALADAAARAQALDPQSSFIVEAPAGSGKTGLLVQRFLGQLLDPELGRPAEVMAITFTRKATAELVDRVMKELRVTDDPLPTDATAFEKTTRNLARQVLERCIERGWSLLDASALLNIRSIDSVCSAIAAASPVLSGVGGPRRLVEDADPLYRVAARRTLFELGGADGALSAALRRILLHRDAKLDEVERLLALMLGAREQWGELIPLDPALLTDERLDTEIRPRLEAALEAIVCSGLSRVERLMPPSALAELSELASAWSDLPGYKGELSPLGICGQVSGPPEARADSLEHWRALSALVLKKDGQWRLSKQSFNRNYLGFEIPKDGGSRLLELVQTLENDRLREALCAVHALPPARYPDEQWEVAKALFHVLRHALVELKLLFAERGECDFAEISIAARAALDAEPTLGDLALTGGDGRLRHLLVDEMQDTSAAQYALLEQLTRSWDGHTQTVFLVGDPKQSIYQFRQARVERFLEAMRDGRLEEIALTPLQLRLNFRSQAALVQSVNALFEGVFPAFADLERGSADVPFVEAMSARPQTIAAAVTWHAKVLRAAEGERKPDLSRHRRTEAREIAAQIKEWRARPLPADRTKPWRIAVLARARTHLAETVRELRTADIPFRAVDIEVLRERQEVLDCLALTRALMHPADRIAWLAVLRAPWCGLTLADLLTLTGEGLDADRQATVAELVHNRRMLLSSGGQALLDRAWPVLETAVHARGSSSLAALAERAWWTLGGDLACDSQQRRNVDRYFRLLAELESSTGGGGRVDLRLLEAKLAKLYAEATTLAPEEPSVELMTIHHAKGLEWDFIVVPGLERQPPPNRDDLLNWAELDSSGPAGASHVLLAPIQTAGEPSTALNRWLKGVRSDRDKAERKRVLYVACTRAREELHLFGAADCSARGEVSRPHPGSLLSACWPAVESRFGVAEPETTPDLIADQLRQALSELDAPEPTALSLAAADDDTPGDPVAEAFASDLHRAPPHIHRLRLDLHPEARFRNAPGFVLAQSAPARLDRPEGSFAARAFGNVVHRALDLAAGLLAAGSSLNTLRDDVSTWMPRLAALLRSEGLAPALATQGAERARDALTRSLADPVGAWILAPHDEAGGEWSVTGVGGTLRADRTFIAGPAPQSAGGTHVWIVDFKTTSRGARDLDTFRDTEREKYRAQLESYAAARRALLPDGRPIRLGLFYPLDAIFLDWESDSTSGGFTRLGDSGTPQDGDML